MIRDYFVNLPDLVRFAGAWQSRKGEQNWDALCDIEPPGGNGLIDLDDLKSLTDDWLMLGMINNSDIAGPAGTDGFVNMLDLACLAKNWGVAENIIKYDEDFETGNFSKLPWVQSGDGPWRIVSSDKFQGTNSAKSADLAWYKESIMSVTVTCGKGDVCFMLKNGGGGGLQFSVDGEIMFTQYADNWQLLDWCLVTVSVLADTHTFQWSYSPDGFGDEHAWIDAIRFP